MVEGQELLPQGAVIFDDAVMDQGQAAGAVGVGVGVRVAGDAVGGPAGVADADVAGQGLFPDEVFQDLEAALFLGQVKAAPFSVAMPLES